MRVTISWRYCIAFEVMLLFLVFFFSLSVTPEQEGTSFRFTSDFRYADWVKRCVTMEIDGTRQRCC